MRKFVALAGLVALGCATQRGAGGDGGDGNSWTAAIRAVGGSGHSGSATAAPMDGGTHVTVNLLGGSGGGAHPWHVHEGVCESNGPIVGAASAYPVLQPDASGNATASAHLNVPLDPDGSYYVNVHQSANQLDVIVGCGELRGG